VTAKSFDLMPLLVFAPGPVGGAAGRLDANVTIRGADLATAMVIGEVHLTDARVPIAPAVGTLRRAKIDLVVRGNDVHVTLDGRLGGGTVKATGSIGLLGATTTSGKVKMTVRGVRPIGVVEPSIDADVTVAMRRERASWVADIDVKNAVVKVPSSRGEPLAPPGSPTDMVFVAGDRITRRPMERRPPAEPIVTANITLGPTRVESEELRGIVRGKLTVTADTYSIGVKGVIEADRGELGLFGRRYRAERAVMRFDGDLDPMLDVSLIHEFPDVVTITQVRGRASRPRVTLSSNPGTYSEGQLLGFLLGGEPSGDRGGAGDRATSAGASYVANRIGGYFKKALPIDLDVLRYEAATTTTSAAITVGTWLKHDLFLAYRRRLEARPDENSGEGEVEYWLWRRVVIEGVIGDRGRNAIDLLWRKRY
jgi:autotransporter translocation and assembly factor TamB